MTDENPRNKIVSYSELLKFDTCYRQWYYQFGLGLRAEELADAPATGLNGHKLLQTYYNVLKEGKTKEEAIVIVQHAAKKILDTNTKGILKAEGIVNGGLLKAWAMVDKYIRENPITAKIELVENRFLIPASLFSVDPLLEDIQIGFTPDVVFAREGGFLDVEDSKFVQRAWPKKKIDRFPQSKIYQIFLERMGYNISRSSIKFFNVTTGEIKVQNYVMSEEEKQILLGDLMGAIKELVIFRSRPLEILKNARRTMDYTACQFCPYELPCTLEAQGKDATKTLTHLYKKNEYDYSV